MFQGCGAVEKHPDPAELLTSGSTRAANAQPNLEGRGQAGWHAAGPGAERSIPPASSVSPHRPHPGTGESTNTGGKKK